MKQSPTKPLIVYPVKVNGKRFDHKKDMNKTTQNGSEIIQTKDKLTVNGKTYYIPKHVQSKSSSVKLINGKMIINGYDFNPNTGEFSKPKRLIESFVLLCVAIFLIYLACK